MKCTIKETKPSGEVKEDSFTFEDNTDKPDVQDKPVAPGPTVPVLRLAALLAMMLGGAKCPRK